MKGWMKCNLLQGAQLKENRHHQQQHHGQMENWKEEAKIVCFRSKRYVTLHIKGPNTVLVHRPAATLVASSLQKNNSDHHIIKSDD